MRTVAREDREFLRKHPPATGRDVNPTLGIDVTAEVVPVSRTNAERTSPSFRGFSYSIIAEGTGLQFHSGEITRSSGVRLRETRPMPMANDAPDYAGPAVRSPTTRNPVMKSHWIGPVSVARAMLAVEP